jgi:hypothetical protein
MGNILLTRIVPERRREDEDPPERLVDLRLRQVPQQHGSTHGVADDDRAIVQPGAFCGKPCRPGLILGILLVRHVGVYHGEVGPEGMLQRCRQRLILRIRARAGTLDKQHLLCHGDRSSSHRYILRHCGEPTLPHPRPGAMLTPSGKPDPSRKRLPPARRGC